ncbi:MAG: ATP-binding protein [Opitutaceae bacterium]|nr:ATP-binding protein [Opitutaceae bacterium]
MKLHPGRLLCVWLLLGLAPAGSAAAPALPSPSASAAGLAAVERLTTSRAFVSGPVTAFARSTDGTLFVGSALLATFDGWSWRSINVPGAKRFLALAAVDSGAGASSGGNGGAEPAPSPPGRERIWVGAVGAIGYLERNSAGEWIFISLAEPLAALDITDADEIRYVHPTPDGALFVTRSKILRWNGRSFACWDLPSPTRLYAFSVNGALLVHQPDVGLWRMEATGPQLWLPQKSLPAAGPMVDYFAVGKDGGLAVFATQIHRRDGDQWTRLDEVSAILQDMTAVHAAQMTDGTIVIGTPRDGVVLMRADGKVQGVVNSRSGLADDNVHSVWTNEPGQIWIGLATGIARLHDIGCVSLFDDRLGLGSGGRFVRKVFWHEDRIHVLTSQSVYALTRSDPLEPARFSRIEKIWMPLWDAASCDGRLWLGGSDGLWQVEGDRAVQKRQTSSEVTLLATPRALPHGLLFFSNDASQAWFSSDRGGEFRELPLSLDGAPTSVVEDDEEALWIASLSGRITAYVWDEAGRQFRSTARYKLENGTPNPPARPLLSCLGGTLVAFTEDAILARTAPTGDFRKIEAFAGWLGIAAAPATRSGQAYWLLQRQEFGADGPYALLRVQRTAAGTEPFSSTLLAAPALDHLGSVTSLSTTTEDGREVLWIGGVNGLVRYETAKLHPAERRPRVAMRSVHVDLNDRPMAVDIVRDDFPAPVSRLAFMFPADVTVTGDTVRYQTKLEGVEHDWSPLQPEPQREFTGLAPGDYVFTARAVDRFGRSGPLLRYPFAVAAPWYWRTPILVLYAIGLALLAYSVIRWRLHQLRRQTERLNQLVNERTRELTLSNMAKSEFLENISHEIRNPLNGIIGLTGMLDRNSPPEKQREYARALKECSESLARAFNEVLDFSKLEYGYVLLEERAFSLGLLLETVQAVFLGPASQQGSTITVRLPAGFKDGFWGDDGKIRTVLNNFVGNALKYAPGTPVVITAACEELGDGKVDVLIEVSDEGPGVPPEEQELIFKKFVRGSRAKEDNVPGTGLGLATCRMLAKILSGSIGVESEPGRGSTFFLNLPLTRHSPAQRPAASTAPAVPVATPATEAGGPWALIIEDQPYNQVVLADILAELNYQAECAAQADLAFAAVARRRFELVLIDLELPGLKGPEIARRLRTLPSSREAVLIGTSASDSREAAQQCMEAGMDAFLLKPLDTASIRAAIREARARRRPPAGAEPGLDCTAFERYARKNPGGLPEAVRAYVSALQSELAALGQAVRANAREDIVRFAHRVRSHAFIINATRLSQPAGELEIAARAGPIGNGEERWQEILRAAADVERQLNARFARENPAPAQNPSRSHTA